MIRILLLLLVPAFFAKAELKISWTNNLLKVSGPPAGEMEIWYLEAFCRPGAFDREWGKTVFPHKTVLVENQGEKKLKFRTTVQWGVEVLHTVTAGMDELDIRFELENKGSAFADIQWFQPACIRVERFTGRNQSNYTERSFIFTEKGLTTLAQTKRTEEALYKGGQVYLPKGTAKADSNPRPVSHDKPVNGLIGCYSADGKWIMATASDKTHELFEGVYVCLHSDPRIDGLKPGEKKQIRSKIYFLPNDVKALLARYKKDFPQ